MYHVYVTQNLNVILYLKANQIAITYVSNLNSRHIFSDPDKKEYISFVLFSALFSNWMVAEPSRE